MHRGDSHGNRGSAIAEQHPYNNSKLYGNLKNNSTMHGATQALAMQQKAGTRVSTANVTVTNPRRLHLRNVTRVSVNSGLNPVSRLFSPQQAMPQNSKTKMEHADAVAATPKEREHLRFDTNGEEHNSNPLIDAFDQNDT